VISLFFHIQSILAHIKIFIIFKIIKFTGVFLKLFFPIFDIKLTNMCIFSINIIFRMINNFIMCAIMTVYKNKYCYQYISSYLKNILVLKIISLHCPKLQILPRDKTRGNHFLPFLTCSIACHFIWWWKTIFFSFLKLNVASVFGASVLCGRSD